MPSPIRELYQVNTTCMEAKGSNEEKRTLLQVRERIEIKTNESLGFNIFLQHR